MRVKEVECKSILSDSGIYGVDYSLNPYKGCEHGCKYCYATFMKRYTDLNDSWGDFVEVKVNARRVLEEDLLKKDKGSILLSSVTDPYQPIEEEYRLTRKILTRLADTKFPVNILTKSDLITRDIDILEQFKKSRISVGFTINFLEEDDRKIWEPNSPSLDKRIEALKKISESGIDSYVHVGPSLEGITDLEKILESTEEYIEELQVENLNLKGKKTVITEKVEEFYPNLKHAYEEITKNDSSYKLRLKKTVEELQKSTEVPISLFLD